MGQNVRVRLRNARDVSGVTRNPQSRERLRCHKPIPNGEQKHPILQHRLAITLRGHRDENLAERQGANRHKINFEGFFIHLWFDCVRLPLLGPCQTLGMVDASFKKIITKSVLSAVMLIAIRSTLKFFFSSICGSILSGCHLLGHAERWA